MAGNSHLEEGLARLHAAFPPGFQFYAGNHLGFTFNPPGLDGIVHFYDVNDSTYNYSDGGAGRTRKESDWYFLAEDVSVLVEKLAGTPVASGKVPGVRVSSHNYVNVRESKYVTSDGDSWNVHLGVVSVIFYPQDRVTDLTKMFTLVKGAVLESAEDSTYQDLNVTKKGTRQIGQIPVAEYHVKLRARAAELRAMAAFSG